MPRSIEKRYVLESKDEMFFLEILVMLSLVLMYARVCMRVCVYVRV